MLLCQGGSYRVSFSIRMEWWIELEIATAKAVPGLPKAATCHRWQMGQLGQQRHQGQFASSAAAAVGPVRQLSSNSSSSRAHMPAEQQQQGQCDS